MLHILGRAIRCAICVTTNALYDLADRIRETIDKYFEFD